MRSLILTGCLWILSVLTHAQGSGRVASGTPLRWGMDGSIEIMEGDLKRYYGSNDTANALRRNNIATAPPVMGNPHNTFISSVQAQCANNTMQLNWVAVQQGGPDRYELEQSSDGRNWKPVGVVLANQTDLGTATYSFTYNRDVSNVLFRIAVTDLGGERVYSDPFHSPCGSTTHLSVTPNPVYSNTTVRVGSSTSARVRLLLLDAKGTVMHSSDVILVQGINHIPINMSGLPAGYYNAVVHWANGRQEVLQVVKQ